MELQIINCEQGTPEWYSARLGIVTASEMGKLLMEGRTKGSESKTRREYMMKLIGERITGEPMWKYSNEHMERGHEQEDQARALYEMVTGHDVAQIGFLRRGRIGCSPDGFIGDEGLLEIKSKLAHLQAEVLLADEVPIEYRAQLQGQLLVSGRQWVDFICFCPKMRPLMKRVFRDEPYLERLKKGVELFESELAVYMTSIVAERAAA